MTNERRVGAKGRAYFIISALALQLFLYAQQSGAEIVPPPAMAFSLSICKRLPEIESCPFMAETATGAPSTARPVFTIRMLPSVFG